jgi:hypothetical protein
MRSSIFGPIPILSEKEDLAPIAKQLAAFEERKQNLLNTLQKEHKIGPNSKPFDADESWEYITDLARHYFWSGVMEHDAISTDEIKRLQQLSTALRKAHGLTQRAIRDGIFDGFLKAWFVQKNISLISAFDLATRFDKDGSSFLIRIVDDIKEMMEALATLAALSDTAATIADVPSKGGRPPLLPRACIQGLARVYRSSTGLKPGRGAGPFADFAYEFMTAVGQTGEYGSLTDAIQEAHQQFEPSWFDEKM